MDGELICPHCGGVVPVPKRGVGVRADNVIEYYYRARAARGTSLHRVTLRRIAEGTGYSYDYLRKVKRRYDAAGKWGAKPRKGSL